MLSAASLCAAAQQAPETRHAALHNAHTADSLGGVRVVIGGMANGVLTRVSPAYNARTFTEAQLVQPVVMSTIDWRALSFAGALNGEGYTLKRGELTPGIFGEGYVDRRHPHTLVHEAMLSLQSQAITFSQWAAGFSVAAGKGFVPFGSDDPMMRPLEKYPVNHHHSQIIERVQTIGAVRVAHDSRFVALELARFNGDEPAGPFDAPRWSRFGDSWSLRTTVQLADGVQLSASRAHVKSPELQQSGAFDHAQHHVALRVDEPNTLGDARYLLAEWARTDEITNNQTAFQYYSTLAEAAYGWHGAQAAVRAELTDRGEQLRLLDPFREPLGHVDFQILGVTRWQVTTLAVQAPPLELPGMASHARVVPFVEVARAFPTPRNRPTVFEPSAFYGKPTLWSLTVGVRVHVGTMRSRMGTYGVMSNGVSHHVM